MKTLLVHMSIAIVASACHVGIAGTKTDPSQLKIEGLSNASLIAADNLLVAIEAGGAFQLDAKTGQIENTYASGSDAFGAIYATDGRAFVTDKAAGTLVELDSASNAIISSIVVGTSPQQPALTASGRIFIPMSGEASIAVVDTAGSLRLLRKIDTGLGTKPHIVSLSPDQKTLWATVQGRDPKVIAISVSSNGEQVAKEFRYDLVPRVLFATNEGAFFTAHHSTGLHFANLATGVASTIYMDVNGTASEPRKQIEGVAANNDGSLLALTHEGRKAVVTLRRTGDGSYERNCDISPLPAKPYWVSLDSAGEVAFVSIPDAGLVQALDIRSCSLSPLWSSSLGGKAKRMSVKP